MEGLDSEICGLQWDKPKRGIPSADPVIWWRVVAEAEEKFLEMMLISEEANEDGQAWT